MPCIVCGIEVDREDPPRYDVLNPEADPEAPEGIGPYCGECFLQTVTGQQMQDVHDTWGAEEPLPEEEEGEIP